MYRIAIIEDDTSCAQQFREMFDQYAQQAQETFSIQHFEDGLQFLNQYTPCYDVIFMDIEMPLLDGMEAAHRLRQLDQSAILVFVTNMAQYAVKGYEVAAFDYILKPVHYGTFQIKLRRILEQLEHNAACLTITHPSGAKRVRLRDIAYIEVHGHKLVFHTQSGPIPGTGSLSQLEQELKPVGFSRCNQCYLVNLAHVSQVDGFDLYLTQGQQLQISRPRKKGFMVDLAAFM